MDPDLLNMLLVVSPVIGLGLLLVWLSARGRSIVRGAFERDGWVVYTRASSPPARGALEQVSAALSGMRQAAWGTKGLYWFGAREDPGSGRSWILAQYQHLAMPLSRYAKPVPLGIAGVLDPRLLGQADVRRGRQPGVLFREIGALFETPAPTGDPEFDAGWTVLSPDPATATAALTAPRRAWLAELPRNLRVVLVPGAVLLVADRWLTDEDVEPIRRMLAAFPG
jgi:hypothetical protein